MSVVILGGNECMEQKYKSLCRDYQHDAKVMVKPVGGVRRKMVKPDMVFFSLAPCPIKCCRMRWAKSRGRT